MKSKKIISLIAILSILSTLGGQLIVTFPMKVKAASTVSNRIGGTDRYETAAKISEYGWKTTSDYAIVATGEDFPDALCAAPLAKKYNAPILLTEKSSLNKFAEAELKRLKVKYVYIVGGTGVVSPDVEKQINSVVTNTYRVAGINRYETSEKIAEQVGTSSKVIVATGEDFPDALSVAPIAAMKGMPILLTNKDSISNEILPYLNNNINLSYVIGGNGVISDKVLQGLKNAKRLAGINRFSTNTAILDEFSDNINLSNIYLATGMDFPDALAGSALAPITESPMVLINDVPDNATKSYINRNYGLISNVIAIGGSGVVSNVSLQNVVNNFGVTPDYDQVKYIPSYGNLNLNMSIDTCGITNVAIKNKFDYKNFTDDKLYALMDTTLDECTRGGLNEAQAKEVWVGKYVGNKYKVVALHYFSVIMAQDDYYKITEDDFSKLIATGITDYKAAAPVVYDDYFTYHYLDDNKKIDCVRIVIEMIPIK